ncbi:Ig-like domain-containing protein [Actinoplanes sp. NPDC051851]|uniref:L,D-transpeptidase n=1 Tax=Actinoplanes sp. NPDC051851 TaxID=3154753 RepID=UPI0034337A76
MGAAAAAAAAGGSAPRANAETLEVRPGQVAGDSVTAATALPLLLSITPETGAKNVSPGKEIVVAVQGGTLGEVTVTSGSSTIEGALGEDGFWRSTEDLAYGKSYEVVASATDAGGATVEKTSTFSTVTPEALAKVTFRANMLTELKKGKTYGAGQPVIVAFSRAVNKKAAEKAIEITTSPKVEGKFYWADSKTVHWRPAKYWAKGTVIKVKVNGLGAKLGDGVYGAKNASTEFTIGRQLIAISDSRTHMTKVYIDGKLVRSMKSSLGKGGGTTGANGQYINYWTASGPHVVLAIERTHTMSSASYGVTDPSNPNYYGAEVVQYCTRITYSGEFLHAAPWNGSLGSANLSHGCVNLSTSDAKWVYENFMLGDVVDVKHTPRELPIWNGLGDWTVSYDKYGA